MQYPSPTRCYTDSGKGERTVTEQNKQPARRVRDMTAGDPVRLILGFAVPMFIGDVFQQFYNLVDTMIAGHFLGDGAIAAIGATAALYSLLMNLTWGLNNGYCLVLSRVFGAGDRQRFRRSTAALIRLDLGIGAALTVLSVAFLRPVMCLLLIPETLFSQSYRYIVIILGGMLTTVAYNGCAGFLRALGNSRTPLYFLIFSSLLNLVLDVFFVVWLHGGIAGAALATVLAQGVSALLCAVYIGKNYRDWLPHAGDWRGERAAAAEMLATGVSMALMQSVFSLGSVILQRAINALSTDIITAHTASRRVYELLMIPMSTVANAASTFAGQNYGAGKYRRIAQATRKMLALEGAWALLSIAASWTVGRPLLVLLTATQNEAVISNALLNLRLSTACFFPLGALLVLRCTMQAMGHKVLPVLSSAIELAVKAVSAAAVVPALGYLGAALTEPVIWCVCALFLALFYGTIGHQKQAEASS